MNVLFQPHSDDAVLFSAFNAIQFKPRVVTVLRSSVQDKFGITHEQRANEDKEAMPVLGCSLEQWPENDANPDWEAIESMMRHLAETEAVNLVFAPAVEEGGHEQHNMVGEIAAKVFTARGQLTKYMTYVRGVGKSRSVHEVVPEAEMIWKKLKALSAYRTQIEEPSTRPWFVEDLREYVA